MLDSQIEHFVTRDGAPMDIAIAYTLSHHEQERLLASGIIADYINYNTASAWFGRLVKDVENSILLFEGAQKRIILEPYQALLEVFYKEQGLEIYSIDDIHKTKATELLSEAFNEIKRDSLAYSNVLSLVRAVQLVKQDEPDNDISYSHPIIPFTVFVSLCKDNSEISNLRVAESILHETMHLKLSLIEKRCNLIVDNEKTFYSPWRDTYRSVQGVMHGIFVFRAILNFYQAILVQDRSNESKDFLEYRVETIRAQLLSINDFGNSMALSVFGRTFVQRLLTFES